MDFNLPFTNGNEVESKLIGVFIKDLIMKLSMRIIRPINFLLPETAGFYKREPFDFEILKNCETLHSKMHEIIKKRKGRENNSNFSKGDLLDILLKDDLFKDNPKEITD